MINRIEGCYRHFKGNNYEVLGEACDVNTNEEFVFYQQLYPPFQYWIRPKDMFFGEKILNNETIKRFIKIEDSQKNILTNIDIYSINITHTETRDYYEIKSKLNDRYMIIKK